MGLSGRKEKQRIGADPRNLAWADDAAKFGSSYLSKFGWDSSKGLGASGDGRISHIKVSQKLDMLGIGAGQQKDPNGIAWKQNKDFERLLQRLNAGAEVEAKVEAAEGGDEDDKKRKREDGEEAVVKKKRRKSEPATEVVVAVEPVKPLIPHHRAHRARAIAAKSMASKSAVSISEILGIAPTPSTTTSPSLEGSLTTYEDGVPLEKLTTSTKSVADYFKDKLLAKAGKSASATPTPLDDIIAESDYDAPRGGLGSIRVKSEKQEDDVHLPVRMGLSNLSSTLSASFFASTSVLATESTITVKVEEEEAKVGKKKRRSSEDDTGKRKDKKNRRRRVDESESTTPEVDAPVEIAPVEKEKKKKKKERRKEEALAVKEEPLLGSIEDAVDKHARKRAKQERKRLKAMKKEQKETL